jgi:hypothetical protein
LASECILQTSTSLRELDDRETVDQAGPQRHALRN